MPATHQRSRHGRWESWPPTQMRLRPSMENDDAEIEDLDLAMEENPINYFLTPASPSYEDDLDMMDFDAGIEDSKHPVPIVRSVSPSSLEGLRLPPPRPPTPPKSPSTPDLDMDLSSSPDDGEDYIRFSGDRDHSFESPFGMKRRQRPNNKSPNVLYPPVSHHTTFITSRGRVVARPGPQPLGPASALATRSRACPARQPLHSWREPSPDVWSIEEEREEERDVKISSSVVDDGQRGRVMKANCVDIPAAKPKKRVRFVLPVRDAQEEL